MVLVSYSGKEINAKLVYYGPGLSGKTTNLEYIYGSIPGSNRGKMVSMKTKTERTLFFDFLPVQLGELSGFKTRFLLYTVPGQVYYNATRKLVLKGVDAVVFVADSKRGKMDENVESLENLRENLREHGLKLDEIPFVLQYNKRDLPEVYSVAELDQVLNPLRVPAYEATATNGAGVIETFKAVSKLLLSKLASEVGVPIAATGTGTPSAQTPAPPAQRVAPRAEVPAPPVQPAVTRPAQAPPSGVPQLERHSIPGETQARPPATAQGVPGHSGEGMQDAPSSAATFDRSASHDLRAPTVGDRLRKWLRRSDEAADSIDSESVEPPPRAIEAAPVAPPVGIVQSGSHSFPGAIPRTPDRAFGSDDAARPALGNSSARAERPPIERSSVESPDPTPERVASESLVQPLAREESSSQFVVQDSIESGRGIRTDARVDAPPVAQPPVTLAPLASTSWMQEPRPVESRQAPAGPREIVVPIELRPEDLDTGIVLRLSIQLADDEESRRAA